MTEEEIEEGYDGDVSYLVESLSSLNIADRRTNENKYSLLKPDDKSKIRKSLRYFELLERLLRTTNYINVMNRNFLRTLVETLEDKNNFSVLFSPKKYLSVSVRSELINVELERNYC
jgi:hypothetical protein